MDSSASSSAAAAAGIARISATDVHRICSGQVVTDLATALKELVENSLDAGATAIEIRLNNYGADGIEVSDNGPGIPKSDHDAVALKHHTSKIASFEDVARVKSFGFRGEALSSLCELAQTLEITTRTNDDPIGTTLSFGSDGRVASRSQRARAVGTTVKVHELFGRWPVRRKELLRSVKRQYARALLHLQAYAVLQTSVRMSCYCTNAKGKRQRVFSTQAGSSIRSNISSIFGAKFVSTLTQLEATAAAPTQGTNAAGGDVCASTEIEPELVVSLSGLVSKVGCGVGRSTNDRQFIFVNGRPVDSTRIRSLIADTWRQYEMKQRPAFFVELTMPVGTFDINMTPNKREILFSNEKLILERLQSALTKIWEPSRGSFRVQNIDHLMSSVTQRRLRGAVELATPCLPAPSTAEAGGHHGKSDTVETADSAISTDCRPGNGAPQNAASSESSAVGVASTSTASSFIAMSSAMDVLTNACSTSPSPSCSPRVLTRQEVAENVATQPMPRADKDTAPAESSRKRAPCSADAGIEGRTSKRTKLQEQPEAAKRGEQAARVLVEVDEISANFARLRSQCAELRKQRRVGSIVGPSSCAAADDEDGEGEESAMHRRLHKSDFVKMHVIGQFNRGFIIARFGNDLYIIDQHAADEKYNFERYRRDTIMHTQKLLAPIRLHVPASEELTISENLDVFKRSGFEISTDEVDGLRLISVPFSKQTQFGVDDVHDLAALLSESHDKAACRPPRLDAMFASRACRSSIMIGRALEHAEMQKVVRHLAELQQPWNCPHGRPTMHHLLAVPQ